MFQIHMIQKVNGSYEYSKAFGDQYRLTKRLSNLHLNRPSAADFPHNVSWHVHSRTWNAKFGNSLLNKIVRLKFA